MNHLGRICGGLWPGREAIITTPFPPGALRLYIVLSSIATAFDALTTKQTCRNANALAVSVLDKNGTRRADTL